MKLRLTTIVIFLLLGAIANVLAAWGCSLQGDVGPLGNVRVTFHPDHQRAVNWWRRNAPKGYQGHPPSSKVDVLQIRRFGSRRLSYHDEGGVPNREFRHFGSRHQHGWPFAALEWIEWRDIRSPQSIARGAFDLHLGRRTIHLPLLPVWPGFLINSSLFGLIVWLLWSTWRERCRRHRRRRGLCEKCAYPIGVSAICTECGAAVPRKVEA